MEFDLSTVNKQTIVIRHRIFLRCCVMMMLLFFLKYLLVGCVISCLLEAVVTAVDKELEFSLGEKTLCIVLWPIMAVIFVFYFTKGLLEG